MRRGTCSRACGLLALAAAAALLPSSSSPGVASAAVLRRSSRAGGLDDKKDPCDKQAQAVVTVDTIEKEAEEVKHAADQAVSASRDLTASVQEARGAELVEQKAGALSQAKAVRVEELKETVEKEDQEMKASERKVVEEKQEAAVAAGTPLPPSVKTEFRMQNVKCGDMIAEMKTKIMDMVANGVATAIPNAVEDADVHVSMICVQDVNGKATELWTDDSSFGRYPPAAAAAALPQLTTKKEQQVPTYYLLIIAWFTVPAGSNAAQLNGYITPAWTQKLLGEVLLLRNPPKEPAAAELPALVPAVPTEQLTVSEPAVADVPAPPPPPPASPLAVASAKVEAASQEHKAATEREELEVTQEEEEQAEDEQTVGGMEVMRDAAKAKADTAKAEGAEQIVEEVETLASPQVVRQVKTQAILVTPKLESLPPDTAKDEKQKLEAAGEELKQASTEAAKAAAVLVEEKKKIVEASSSAQTQEARNLNDMVGTVKALKESLEPCDAVAAPAAPAFLQNEAGSPPAWKLRLRLPCPTALGSASASTSPAEGSSWPFASWP